MSPTTNVIRSSDIARCPIHAFGADHYLSDGSCLCTPMTQARWDRLSAADRDRVRDDSDLTPQLVGLEGWRVEVTEGVDDAGEPRRRRFYVGRSTGWRPIHLEVARKDSSGGFAASSRYDSVRRLYRREGL